MFYIFLRIFVSGPRKDIDWKGEYVWLRWRINYADSGRGIVTRTKDFLCFTLTLNVFIWCLIIYLIYDYLGHSDSIWVIFSSHKGFALIDKCLNNKYC